MPWADPTPPRSWSSPVLWILFGFLIGVMLVSAWGTAPGQWAGWNPFTVFWMACSLESSPWVAWLASGLRDHARELKWGLGGAAVSGAVMIAPPQLRGHALKRIAEGFLAKGAHSHPHPALSYASFPTTTFPLYMPPSHPTSHVVDFPHPTPGRCSHLSLAHNATPCAGDLMAQLLTQQMNNQIPPWVLWQMQQMHNSPDGWHRKDQLALGNTPVRFNN